MRDAFAAEIVARAQQDSRVVLLSGDIGNRLFDEFKARFRERFFNCGVAEANMMSVAAGMALSGLRPVVYTIAPFITSRCLEQIRVDVCYHNVPVTIVGVGAGLSYASLGPTHHSCEDIAFMRALPGMQVVCPGDGHEVKLALQAVLTQDQPCYLRLGKKGEPLVHGSSPHFVLGKAIPLRSGQDICILATGNILPVAMDAARALGTWGVDAAVYSMHTVKPLDGELLEAVFMTYPLVVTLEEHGLIGGFGAAVAEWVVDRAAPRQPSWARLLRFGTADTFLDEAGNHAYARERLGLSAAQVGASIRDALDVNRHGELRTFSHRP